MDSFSLESCLNSNNKDACFQAMHFSELVAVVWSISSFFTVNWHDSGLIILFIENKTN